MQIVSIQSLLLGFPARHFSWTCNRSAIHNKIICNLLPSRERRPHPDVGHVPVPDGETLPADLREVIRAVDQHL